jgi:adenylate cyclase
MAKGADRDVDPETFVARIRAQLRVSAIVANAVGGVVVFVFAAFVLPRPPDVRTRSWLLWLNLGLFLAGGALIVPALSLLLSRLWNARAAWLSEARDPTERERALTLRFPLTEHAVIAATWLLAAGLFGLVNVVFSPLLALSVAITVVLGGLVTVALGYLTAERLLRPVMAEALATGLPERPQLPGVQARALLSWTLGTGAVLIGVALVGLAALLFGNFTTTRLAIVGVILSVIGLGFGAAAMVGLARSLAHPIAGLREAVGALERGSLDHEVTVDDGSEVGLLQAGFNRMLAGLREREHIRDLFGRQVGEDVVEHALERGVELGGELREAAVLFVDLQGSTRLAAERAPEEVVELLNRFFAVVVEVVADCGGWVNKFEGDAALCVFGVPLEDASCAGKALEAGRRLAERLRSEVPELVAGIGVSAGQVVAGNVGAAKRFEYTVIGDPVNEAARLSEVAKEREKRVLASHAAVERAGEAESRRWRSGEEVELRGRREPTRLAAPH